MISVAHQIGLPLVALLVFVTELGIPTGVPNEAFLLVAGATDIHSWPGLAGAIGFVALADLLGTTTLFLLAHTGGGRLATRLLRGRDRERGLARWRGWVAHSARRDVTVVVAGRLLPLARMPFTLSMGLLGLRLRYFLLGAIPGACIWAGWPLTVGYLLHSRVNEAIGPIERLSRIGGTLLLLVVGLVVVAMLGRWAWRRRRVPRGKSQEGAETAPAPEATVSGTSSVNHAGGPGA